MRSGTRIRLRRESQGISRKELAERSGIPRRTLEKIEQGVTEFPTVQQIQMVAGALGGDCRDYFPNEEPEPLPLAPGRPPATPPKPAKGRRKG